MSLKDHDKKMLEKFREKFNLECQKPFAHSTEKCISLSGLEIHERDKEIENFLLQNNKQLKSEIRGELVDNDLTTK